MLKKIPYNKLNNKDKKNIIDLYYKDKNKNFKEISDELNFSERSISRVLQESKINTNLKNRYIIKNENYFKNIDSEFKAYILGFIYADGYIGDNYEVVMSLSDKVYDNFIILNKLKEEIGLSKDIKHGKSKINDKEFGYWSFRIVNKTIWEDLYNLNLFPRKSLTMDKFPNIDFKLMNHFIRGYFDGDGSICSYIDTYDNRTRNNFEILGTKEFLNIMQDILVEKCEIKKTALHKTHSEGITRISYKGNKSIIKIRNYLYYNAITYLTYKKERMFNI